MSTDPTESLKRASDFLVLALQMIVNCLMLGADIQTWVICKSSTHS